MMRQTRHADSHAMKRDLLFLRPRWAGWVLCAFLMGCATSPKTNWSRRVGNLTFDQAVAELGPPSETNHVTDGGLIAQWVTGHAWGNAFNPATDGFYGAYVGYRATPASFPGHVLALKFGPDRKLVEWARVNR